jgi:hypothetical protein
MATTLINISNYTCRFEAYPQDLLDFAAKHNFTLLPIESMKGQALALMAQPEVRGQQHIRPPDAVQFFVNIGMETRDAIQQFNKATGLKRMKMRGLYCLQYPYELDMTDIDKRKGVAISGDKDAAVNSIKAWFTTHVVDVPASEWQIGHLDPTTDDSSEKNLAWQPPIQGKYRDRFKFDASFLKMWPTAEKELIPKFDEYYTEKEQRAILAALKAKFEPPQ